MSQQQGDIQERIAAARREADSLKEKIRAKKESSADTSREWFVRLLSRSSSRWYALVSKSNGSRSRSFTTHRYAASTRSQRPSRQDICHALGGRSKASCLGFTGRQTHRL